MKTFLLLGSNLGDRQQRLFGASGMISKYCGDIINHSSVWQSRAWGFDSNHDFLNQVVVISWNKGPEALMDIILRIEEELGRVRTMEKGYTDRVIDIDILAIQNLVHSSSTVTVPHVFLPERAFALLPMLEVAADWIHPMNGKTVGQMLNEIDSTGTQKYHHVHSN